MSSVQKQEQMPPSEKNLAIVQKARVATLVLVVLLAFALQALPHIVGLIIAPQPTPLMLFSQDMVLAPVLCVALLLFRPAASGSAPSCRALPAWVVPGIAALLFVFCWWGHSLILAGLDLSRDEQLANFDAVIYRSGQVLAPIPGAWRAYAPALNLLYIAPIGGNVGWVSAYLPGNAAVRALIGMVADPAITSPVEVVAGFLALNAIGKRLWPASPASRLASLSCYAVSSQILIAGMSAYAMSLHLALNLVWLALFLRGDRIGLGGTLLVGFVATGAHQPLFHPMFVLPFLAGLVWQRDWRRSAIYFVGYAAIAAFWLWWPFWVSGHGAPVQVHPEGIGYVERLQLTVRGFTASSLWLMAANLLRFVVWQHLALLPLLLLGVRTGDRSAPLPWYLAAGLLLPILTMAVVLPWQANGWGYRYLHPVLGNACLLAGFGWQWLERAGLDARRAMIGTTFASLALLLPAHGWMAHAMTMPQAVLERRVEAIPADIVVVDDAPFSFALVINRPDLSNRPIRLLGGALHPADMAVLCSRGRIAFVDAPALNGLAAQYHDPLADRPTEHQGALETAARAANCPLSGG